MVVAEPMPKDEIIRLQQEIYSVYNLVAPWAKKQIQMGHSIRMCGELTLPIPYDH